MFTLQEIKKQVNRLAKQINAPTNVLPTYGSSKHDGTPHIEVDGKKYLYIVYDRGQTVRNSQTLDIQELLYWIFRDITSALGNSFELTHRNPDVDSRRLAFQHQLELLKIIDKQWKEKREQEIEEILNTNPYKDKTD